MSKLMDLTGCTYGRLTVVERGEDYIAPNGARHVRWLCKCSCGNPQLIPIAANNLRRGITRSCGCIKEERLRAGKKENHYEFYDDYIVGYTEKGNTFLIDRSVYEKIRPYCWCVTRNGYLVARAPDGRIVRLHRLILDAMNGEVIDHINHDVSDNRKCNLRVVNHADNMKNCSIRTTNSSGVPGVCYHRPSGGWMSRINVNGKTLYLGYYKSFNDAVVARKAGEEKYFGEYSYDNSIASVPRIAV